MATRIPIPAPTIQRQHLLPEGMPVARVPNVRLGNPWGQAAAATMQTAAQAASVAQSVWSARQTMQAEQANAWLSKANSDDQLKWTQQLTERQQAAPLGAENFTPGILEDFDKYAEEAVNNAPKQARSAYRENLNRLRTELGKKALQFEAASARNHLLSQYGEGEQADAAAIALDPSLYEERREARLGALAESKLPEDVKRDLAAKSEAALALAAGKTLAQTQPRAVLDAMAAAAEDKPVAQGYGWVKHLDADRVAQLRSQAQAELDRRENKLKQAAAQRNQAAAGALSAYSKQLSMGVPPRPEDMQRWSDAVKGSEHAATFGRLQQGWGKVQSILSKPVGEQLAALQEMHTRLQKEGGNAQDVMLLELARKGVQANVQMQTEAPLQWLEEFADTPIEPLPLGDLGTPAGNAAIADTLAERDNAIAALKEQNPGVAINDSLLLPGEAQQLTEAFAQSNAREAGQLLKSLVAVAGPDNQARLDAVLSQLEATGAGDAQDLARIAAIAAQESRITLKSHIFSADKVQSNGQAVATILHGRDILAANGKGAGGVALKLPKDAELMQEILDEVGAAYASPVPGDSGYAALARDAQIVKYWYVGEAARQGALNEKLDSGLVKQALRATLGEQTEVAGKKVLMPRGMDEGQFKRQASVAIENALKEQDLWSPQSDVSDYGLLGMGQGSYMVTLGDDPTGLIIRIDPNDEKAVSASQQQALEQQTERTRARLPRSRSRYLQQQQEAAQDDAP